MHKVTFILLIIGGVNWLLEVFGTGLGYWLPANLANLVYVLVGLSAIYEVFSHKNTCKHCVPGSGYKSQSGPSQPASPMQS